MKSAIRSLVLYILRFLALLLVVGGGVAVFRISRAYHPDAGIPLDLFPAVVLHAVRLVLVPVTGFAFVIDSVSTRNPAGGSSSLVVLFKVAILLALIGFGSIGLRQATEGVPVPHGALALRVRAQTLISFHERSIFVSDVDGLHLRGVVVFDPERDPAMHFVEHATLDPFREQISLPDLEMTLRLSDASDGFLEILSLPTVLEYLSDSFTALLRQTEQVLDSGLLLYLIHVSGIGLIVFGAGRFARSGTWPLPNFVFGILIVALLPAASVLSADLAAHDLTRRVFTPAVEPFFAPVVLVVTGTLLGLAAWIRNLVHGRDAGGGIHA
ncbi:MAG: hypothetical protein EA383_01790 [Spirochaetaceae bacterium]|nr:MAG: hypothetical protein EA383_01790 [Spirochaetaceae bacterium]